MKLYLMRHGETLFNTQKRVQGWCDSPLTENGIWQAEQAKQYFAKKGISFDAVYSSTQDLGFFADGERTKKQDA